MPNEDDLDAEMANRLRETLDMEDKKSDTTPPTPPERETQPEMPDEAKEAIGVVVQIATAMAGAAAASFSKMWNSLCLIGPSLERIATAHETLAKEAEIMNKAYDHDVNQRHHAMKG
jgi:hypothetical protein